MTDLTKYFINQFKEDKEWEKKQKSKYTELNDYFKYSGEVEEEKKVFEFESQRSSKYVYDYNKRCHTLHKIRDNKK
jgi:hypothetical protein